MTRSSIDGESARGVQPRLCSGHRDLMRAAEQSARGHLHEREVVPAGVRERRRIVGGIALGQRRAEGGKRKRLRAEQRSRPVEDRIQVDARETRAHLGMCSQLPVEDGPEQRPEREAIVGRQQVDGAADRGDPHHLSLRRATCRGRVRRTPPGATRGPGRDSRAPAPAARPAGAPPTAHRGAHVRAAVVVATSSGSSPAVIDPPRSYATRALIAAVDNASRG